MHHLMLNSSAYVMPPTAKRNRVGTKTPKGKPHLHAGKSYPLIIKELTTGKTNNTVKIYVSPGTKIINQQA